MFRVLLLAALSSCALAEVPMPDGRIVGGQETTIENFPHQISLQYVLMGHMCGGSIYKENVVITAAHCVDGAPTSLLRIVAGTTSKSSGGVSLSVDKVYKHENYNSKTVENDIAIIITKGSFTFSEKIQPIGLPAANDEARAGSKAIVSGWGSLKEGGLSPSKLQYVEVNIVSLEECAKAYGSSNPVTESMLCAGVSGGGKDACQGDSGGPLIIGSTLVGIVSWGSGCARPDYPGVYSNVAYLRNWIDAKLA